MKYILVILFFVSICISTNKICAQTLLVYTGKVVDKETQQPLSAVSIINGETSKHTGVLTNSNGYFSVKVPVGTKLIFNFVGYDKSEITTTDSNDKEIVVYLSPKSNNNLKDVKVMGFKKVKSDLNTGASITISGKELQNIPAASVEDVLQGRVAGLNIQNNNGSPGAPTSMFLRGLASIQTTGTGASAYLQPTSPLFVVDGVPIDMNQGYAYGFDQAGPGLSPLAAIPIEDIESITVLKDAAATALWGSKGAYGVIIIETRRGNSEVPYIQYSGNFFYSAVPKLRDVIGGREERMLRINQVLNFDTSYADALDRINAVSILSDSLNAYYNNSTNWQSVFYKPTYNYTHNVNILGGNTKLNYKINTGIFKQGGIVKNTGLTRYNIDMNARYQPSEQFIFTVSINSSLSQKENGSGNGLIQQGAANGSNASSLLPPPSLYSANNDALAGILVQDNNKIVTSQPSINIQWSPIPELQLITNDNYSFSSATSDNYRPSIINGGNGLYTTINSRTYGAYSRNSINFIKSIGRSKKDSSASIHSINAYIFTELQTNSSRTNEQDLTGTASDYLINPNAYEFYTLRAGTDPASILDSRTFAYGGDINYSYKLRYVIDFQYRSQASSTNGPSIGYTKSPTVSARWNMHNEAWWKKFAPWANVSDVRFSYGTTLIPSGTVFDVYGEYDKGPQYNGQPSVVSNFGTIPNPRYKPISNTQLDIGYDGTFFNNQFNIMYDFYYSENKNQPFSLQLPNTIGFSSIQTNQESIVNYGHELTLSYNSPPSTNKNTITWNISVNAAYNRSILAQLPNNMREIITPDPTSGFITLNRVGAFPIQTMVFNTVGVYPTNGSVVIDPLTGRPIGVGVGTNVFLVGGSPHWTDLNGDYIIDNNDLTTINGQPQPKVTGGIQFYVQYRQWSLRTNISATLYRYIINTSLAEKFQSFADPLFLSTNPLTSGVLLPINKYNYWQQSGDNAIYPNPMNYLYNATINPFRWNQSLFVENGSYWKLNSVTLSYNIKSDWSKRFGISSAQVYFTGANLLILSPYSGASPENVTTLGFDNSNGYPNSKNYTIGLNIQF